MTGFILAATLLVLVILAILLPPLLRAPKAARVVDRKDANLDIFRDQLSELERDRNEGSLAEADFEQARSELQRRLLEEVQTETVKPGKTGGRKTALALLVVVPLAAAAGYMVLGNPQAFDPMVNQPRMSTGQMDEMLAKLAAKLKANPDDSKGWVMLARSYKALGRFPEAAEAYGHGGAMVDGDAALLADYAEVLAQVSGSLEGRPGKLIARALQLAPDEPQALFLAGAAANDRRDFEAVADYWGRLVVQLEPGSEEAKSLGDAVEKAREIVAQAGESAGKGAGDKSVVKNTDRNAGGKTANEGQVAQNAATVAGEITISGKIAAQAKPDDLLFIFARADEGSRMPLAVMRNQVSDLPLNFRLDDSMALPGGQKISEHKTVTIEARIAKAGKAQSSSGDLFGSVKGVQPGRKDVEVVIDQVQP